MVVSPVDLLKNHALKVIKSAVHLINNQKKLQFLACIICPMPLFDAYIFADWSAANSPGPGRPSANAVWVGECLPQKDHQQETYHRTRRNGADHVAHILEDHVSHGRRVLVGFDFCYGYPAGFGKALGLPSGPESWWWIWAQLADRGRDSETNVNNRFHVAGKLNGIVGDGRPGPFWGCPAGKDIPNLRPRSPGFPFRAANGVSLERLRIVETRLSGVQETWGLYGPGRVGGQTLTGLPCVYGLRKRPLFRRCSRVWPFETRFTEVLPADERPFILHAEVWPGVVETRFKELIRAAPSLIRDRAQVRALCQWASELDDQNALGRFFDAPEGLTSQQLRGCMEEEGWILGAALNDSMLAGQYVS